MKMKKLLAMLLAFAMVMGMSLTTFAAGEKVTVTKVPDGATVSYGQVIKEKNDSVLGWEIVDGFEDEFIAAFTVADDPETADVNEAFVPTEDQVISALIDLGKLENTKGVNSNAIAGTINDSLALNKALENIQNQLSDSVTATTTNNVTTAAFEPAAGIGLYAIKVAKTGYTFVPMSVYVSSSFAGVEVTAKGTENVITKVVDSENNESVSEGDVVGFTASTYYPYYSTNTVANTFEVSDKLTNATFEAGSLVITVAGVTDPLKEGTDYTVNAYGGTDTLEIEFVYNKAYASKAVTIKYNAVVGAGSGDVKNEIKSNFDTTADSVTLDKVQVTISKVNEESVALSGATFAIYEASETEKDGYTATPNVKVNGQQGTTTLYLKDVTSQACTSAVTGADGKLVFTGLDAQKTYYIKETEAPAGYSLNEYYFKLSPTSETGVTTDKEYTFADFTDQTVVDTKLSSLPSTGGIGTAIFTIGGCAIMIAAAYFFFVSRKKEA